MKKILLTVAGVIVLGIVGCVGIIFMATAGVVSAADDFWMMVDEGQYEAAYNATSIDFQEVTTYDDLVVFVEYNELVGNIQETVWTSRSVENNMGNVAGNIVLDDDSHIQMTMDFIKENDMWKVYGIEML